MVPKKHGDKHRQKLGKKVYVKKSKIHGKGLFAARKLPADALIGLIEGKMTKKAGDHVLWLTKKRGIEITNEFRYVNHSDSPNIALIYEEVVTLRAVKADEELTHNYYG